MAENLRGLLLQGRFDELLNCIKIYADLTEDSAEAEKLYELYSFYSEN